MIKGAVLSQNSFCRFITIRKINCNVSPHTQYAQALYQTLYVASFIDNYRQELATYPALTTGTQQVQAIYNITRIHA
ncbi:hypothetical protein SUGI_0018880 [Cryptomeria japonica]|nr:hypothetical protein SUGI_0018880 [Cryptomeria japonica]